MMALRCWHGLHDSDDGGGPVFILLLFPFGCKGTIPGLDFDARSSPTRSKGTRSREKEDGLLVCEL